MKVPRIEERDEAADRGQDDDHNDDDCMESLIWMTMLILAEHMIVHETGLDKGLIQAINSLGLVYESNGRDCMKLLDSCSHLKMYIE